MSKRKHDDSADDENALSPLLALPAELWHQVARHLLPDADAMLCLLATHRAALFLVRYPLVQWLLSLFPTTEVSPDRALDTYLEFHAYLPDLEVLGPPIRAHLAEGATDALLCELLYLVFIARCEYNLAEVIHGEASPRPLRSPSIRVFGCWYVDPMGRVQQLRDLPGIRAQPRHLGGMFQIIMDRLEPWQREVYQDYMEGRATEWCMALHWNVLSHHGTEAERALFPLVDCDHFTKLNQVVIGGAHLYTAEQHKKLRDAIYNSFDDPYMLAGKERRLRGLKQMRQNIFLLHTQGRRGQAVYERMAALLDLEQVIVEGALRDVQDQ
jgi:hypothetical protein